MRKIKQSGSALRWALLHDNYLSQGECAAHTGINSRIVSELLRGRQTFDSKNETERNLIYGYYSEKVLHPISFEDFWCISKTFQEVK